MLKPITVNYQSSALIGTVIILIVIVGGAVGWQVKKSANERAKKQAIALQQETLSKSTKEIETTILCFKKLAPNPQDTGCALGVALDDGMKYVLGGDLHYYSPELIAPGKTIKGKGVILQDSRAAKDYGVAGSFVIEYLEQ